MPNSIKTVVEAFTILNEDVERSAEAMRKAKDIQEKQFWRRAFVRSVFSLIEGTTYILKQAALEDGAKNGVSFTAAELALINEESYELNDKGQVITQTSKLSINRNIKFAFMIYAKAHHKSYALDVGGQGWQGFQKGMKVRNRLMHPKRVEDFTISDDDIVDVTYAGINWFIGSIHECFSVVK